MKKNITSIIVLIIALVSTNANALPVLTTVQKHPFLSLMTAGVVWMKSSQKSANYLADNLSEVDNFFRKYPDKVFNQMSITNNIRQLIH